MQARARGSLLLSSLVCAAVALACGSGDDAGAIAQAGAAASKAQSAAAVPSALPLRPLPASGEVEVSLDQNGLVTALANQAPRGAIVSKLSEVLGFSLVFNPEPELARTLTLRAEHEPIEVVLARVLAGVPNALAYEDSGGTKRLVRLTLGVGSGEPSVASAPPGAERRRRLPEPTPEEQAARAERAQKLWATSLENVASPDAEVRADAARWLNVSTTEGFEAATDRLAHDESPVVRAAAAETLGDADVGAVQPLLQALDDPDPNVVLATLDALEFVGDASTIPHLTPLLKHKDAEVRERTVEAIEFLQ
jgi:hypothetical protein